MALSSVLCVFAEGGEEVAPPEAHGAEESGNGLAVADGMIVTKCGPTGVDDGDAGAGGDCFKGDFDLRAFAGGEVGGAPFEGERVGRAPGVDSAGDEGLAVELFDETAAFGGLEPESARSAAGGAKAGAAAPPKIGFFGEDGKGGGRIGIDGDADADLVAGRHLRFRLLT